MRSFLRLPVRRTTPSPEQHHASLSHHNATWTPKSCRWPVVCPKQWQTCNNFQPLVSVCGTTKSMSLTIMFTRRPASWHTLAAALSTTSKSAPSQHTSPRTRCTMVGIGQSLNETGKLISEHTEINGKISCSCQQAYCATKLIRSPTSKPTAVLGAGKWERILMRLEKEKSNCILKKHQRHANTTTCRPISSVKDCSKIPSRSLVLHEAWIRRDVASTTKHPPKFNVTRKRGKEERILQFDRKNAKYWAPHPSNLHPSNLHPSNLHPPNPPLRVHGAPPSPPTHDNSTHTQKKPKLLTPKNQNLHMQRKPQLWPKSDCPKSLVGTHTHEANNVSRSKKASSRS